MIRDDGGGGQEGEVQSVRARQAEIKQRLQSSISSPDELWELILAPLDLLGVVPSNIPLRLCKYAVWHDCNDEDRRAALRSVSWISDMQRLLLEKVLIDWSEVVQKEEMMHIILQQWFAPNASSQAGSIYIASLATLTSVLSDMQIANGEAAASLQSPHNVANTPVTTASMVASILHLFTANVTLGAVLQNLDVHQSQAKKGIIWNDFIRELVSLPDRVANATKGRSPPELERRWVNRCKYSADMYLSQTSPLSSSEISSR
jgi:hypothetical protein